MDDFPTVNELQLWILDALAQPGTLGDIRKILSSVWEAHPEVPASVKTEIEIATGEIAANVLEHASSERPVHIRMEVLVLLNEVQVRFVDDGLEMRVDLESVRLADEMAERGRGLAIARAVLRRLSYQSTADGNCWTLLSEHFSQ